MLRSDDENKDEKDLLKETERIETLIKPYLTQETVDDLIKEETRGLINWMKGLSDQERQETLDSEKIRHLSSEFGRRANGSEPYQIFVIFTRTHFKS